MRKHLLNWYATRSAAVLFLSASDLSAEPTVFTGTLVRKYYQHLIPRAVEKDSFGWFLELDPFSQASLREKIAALSNEDRESCVKFEFASSFMQICLPGTEDRILCRQLEGQRVEVSGEWPTSPHIFRPIPSYQLHLSQMKAMAEAAVQVSGTLYYKVFPGPPNYDSVEGGDYPEGCWVLKLDDRSKSTLGSLMDLAVDECGDEILIQMKEQNGFVQYENQRVICLGTPDHAETGHHHTPLLLRSCRVIFDEVNCRN